LFTEMPNKAANSLFEEMLILGNWPKGSDASIAKT